MFVYKCDASLAEALKDNGLDNEDITVIIYFNCIHDIYST